MSKYTISESLSYVEHTGVTLPPSISYDYHINALQILNCDVELFVHYNNVVTYQSVARPYSLPTHPSPPAHLHACSSISAKYLALLALSSLAHHHLESIPNNQSEASSGMTQHLPVKHTSIFQYLLPINSFCY